MWNPLRRHKVEKPIHEDDSPGRLEQAIQKNKESEELLRGVVKRGEALKKHVRAEQDFRNQNGFVSTILDSMQARQ